MQKLVCKKCRERFLAALALDQIYYEMANEYDDRN